METSAPTMVLYNAKVHTVDEEFSTAEAIALNGARIVAVGTSRELLDLVGPETRCIDLEGRTVLPGFMDCHLHPLYAAANLDQVQLTACRSIQDVLDRVSERASELEPGEWFRGSNHWTIDVLEETRLPFRTELDQAAPRNPFWVNVAWHRAAANSLALAAAGITKDTPTRFPDQSGYVFKDPDTGEPNGHLLEAAMMAVAYQEPPQTTDELIPAVIRVQELFLENGITSLLDQGSAGPAFPDVAYLDLMERMRSEGLLRMRWRLNHLGFEMTEMPVEEIDGHIARLAELTRQGDDWLRLAGLGELVLDGFVEDHWSREPYGSEVFGEDWCGIRFYSPEAVHAICIAAAKHGMQLNVHCEGDGALDYALGVFEEIHRTHPIDERRWALEHGGMAPTERNIQQCRDMGVIVSTQQPLIYWHSLDIRRYFGEAAAAFFPNRTWLDGGVRLRGGSDFDTAPISPLFGIWTLVSRQTVRGDVIAAHEAISREAAIRMYTSDAAYSVFEEDRIGTLEAGKLADLVVLSDDPLTVDEEAIKDIAVLVTVVDGEVRHDPQGLLS